MAVLCVCVICMHTIYTLLGSVSYVEQVSKPPHGVQQGMVGMLLFLRGCVDNCVMFLSLQNIRRGVALVCLLYVCERNFTYP